MSNALLDSSVLTTLQYEIDDLHEKIEQKIEELSGKNKVAEKFLNLISVRKKLAEEMVRREVVNIKPHHNNYESHEVIDTGYKVERDTKEVDEINRRTEFVDSLPLNSFSGNHMNVGSNSGRNSFENRKSEKRKFVKKKKVVKKKRLPLHVSKKTVKRRNEKKAKTIQTIDKLENVLDIARRTREMIEKKNRSQRIRDKFTSRKKSSKKNAYDESDSIIEVSEVEPITEKKSSQSKFRKTSQQSVKKKMMKKENSSIRRKKKSQKPTNRILKSNVPLNRKKLRKEMKEIEDSYIPVIKQSTEERRSYNPPPPVIEQKQPQPQPQNIDRVMNVEVTKIENNNNEEQQSEKYKSQIRIEHQIKMIRKKQKKLREVKSKYNVISHHFINTNISPFRSETQKKNSRDLIDLSFKLGIFDYLKTVNEILFQSSNIHGGEQDHKEKEEIVNDEEKKNTSLSRIKKELGFLNTWMNEKNVMEDYELSCSKVMYEDLIDQTPENEEDNIMDSIHNHISFLKNKNITSSSSSSSLITTKKRFIWLPLRIYKNIEHLLYPKHLISSDHHSNNILTYQSFGQLRKLYDVRCQFQTGLLYHYIEKVVSKQLMIENEPFLNILRKCKTSNRNETLFGNLDLATNNNNREFLIFWRFLHSVLTQKARSECTFIKNDSKKVHQRREEEEEVEGEYFGDE